MKQHTHLSHCSGTKATLKLLFTSLSFLLLLPFLSLSYEHNDVFMSCNTLANQFTRINLLSPPGMHVFLFQERRPSASVIIFSLNCLLYLRNTGSNLFKDTRDDFYLLARPYFHPSSLTFLIVHIPTHSHFVCAHIYPLRFLTLPALWEKTLSLSQCK